MSFTIRISSAGTAKGFVRHKSGNGQQEMQGMREWANGAEREKKGKVKSEKLGGCGEKPGY